MQILDLNGAWTAQRPGSPERIPAQVPGEIYTDLLAAKKIPHPYYRDNEKDTFWIGETDWCFSRDFEVDSALLAHARLRLCCEGLDTIATVRVNGKTLGTTDNMFRRWAFDLRDVLQLGSNTIEITFASPMDYVTRMNKRRQLPAWTGEKRDAGSWIRKQPCNFGWDWGPALVTCGIWRDIRITAFDTARIDDVQLTQTHRAGAVRIDAAVALERAGRGATSVAMSVRYGGRLVAETTAAPNRGGALLKAAIKRPKLWWPAGMGEQPLYEVEIDLLDAEGNLLDTVTRRVGLRRLELVRKKDRWGESFMFAANGKPFFAKGANWIPADAMLGRLTADDYRRLLEDTAAANMNMLRVWGGGIYEHDVFYDLCDELGICVWQDFMFACATYPTFDEEWMATVKQEAIDNVKRIRHHACLALWCGNNELEQGLVGPEWTPHKMSWTDYKRLFDRLLPSIVKKHDPATAYWPGSPHSPLGDRAKHDNPTCGDAHLWAVWHGRKPFEWYRSCEHRFNSEFGFQSFPEPRAVRAYTVPDDRNVSSPIMEWHQRSYIGNAAIIQYMLDWFRMPTSFDSTLWLSQILQGMAMKYACEHWRRSMPRGMGTLYWQLNDCWPVASWASIDGDGNWKALHYMARKFYAPILVSGLEDAATGTVEVHVTNDLLKTFSGRVEWEVTDAGGKRLGAGSEAARVDERTSRCVAVLGLAQELESSGADQLVVWLRLVSRGALVSENLVTFARPKRMAWQDPGLKVSVRKGKAGAFDVTVRAARPALWTWLELKNTKARYADNFVHLSRGGSCTIQVVPESPMKLDAFRKKLQVRSLRDTYE